MVLPIMTHHKTDDFLGGLNSPENMSNCSANLFVITLPPVLVFKPRQYPQINRVGARLGQIDTGAS